MIHEPRDVIPEPLSRVVEPLPYWFVIGGQAVRCLCPYRPSRDVNFGVRTARDLDDLVEQLGKSGVTEILERAKDTVHLRWTGINVSVFMLAKLAPFTEERRLSVRGIVATNLHAILDRGLRRDFFDLYVTMQTQQVGIAECLSAMAEVYAQPINQSLLLRALTYFEDAEREAQLPGEGKADWTAVKDFFITRVGNLLVPPARRLEIQERRVDVRAKADG